MTSQSAVLDGLANGKYKQRQTKGSKAVATARKVAKGKGKGTKATKGTKAAATGVNALTKKHALELLAAGTAKEGGRRWKQLRKAAGLSTDAPAAKVVIDMTSDDEGPEVVGDDEVQCAHCGSIVKDGPECSECDGLLACTIEYCEYMAKHGWPGPITRANSDVCECCLAEGWCS